MVLAGAAVALLSSGIIVSLQIKDDEGSKRKVSLSLCSISSSRMTPIVSSLES